MPAYQGLNPAAYNVPIGPPAHGWNCVPSDTVPLPNTTSGIYINTTGNLVLVLAGNKPGAAVPLDNPVTFTGIAAGTLLQVAATYVLATGTTAAVTVLW